MSINIDNFFRFYENITENIECSNRQRREISRRHIMEERVKRMKFTKESDITNIVSSIDDITNSLKSISESYNDILRVNTAVVTYLHNTERREKAINQSTEDIEHMSERNSN